MKNNLENQDIKTDKPVPMSYEALKAERDAQQKRADALAVENNKLCKQLTHAEGCFKAAIFEGLDEALVESAGSNLADIVSRRIVHAFPSIGEPTPATSAALAAIEARGVEKFSDFLGKQYQCEKANTARGKAYKHVVFLACRFVNELREGK